MLIISQNKTAGKKIKCLCVNCGAEICEGKFFILKKTTEMDLILKKEGLVVCPVCKTEQEVPDFFSSEEETQNKWLNILMLGADNMFFPARDRLI